MSRAGEGARASHRACGALAVAALAVALATGCAAHDDVTPMIAVQPGAASRAMALLGRLGPSAPRARAPTDDADAGAEDEAGRIVFACVGAVGPMGLLARVPCVATVEAIAKGVSDAGAMDGGASVAAATDDDDENDDEPTEVVAADGKVSVAVAPGAYRVTASHEPEYSSAHFDVEVDEGETAWGAREGAVVLTRIVDTRGYLAADATTRPWSRSWSRSSGDGDPRTKAASWLAAEALRSGDPLDVWSSDDADERERALAAFLARLAAKAPVTPFASQAQTYVRMDDAGQVGAWSAKRDADFARGVRERRDVVLSNGPFLRVTANGAPIGGVARATGRPRDVEVVVHVECAPGVSVERLSIRRARVAAVETRGVALRLAGTARVADATFHLHAATDDAFVVVVDGASAAYAMSGPVWIDANGDGEALGRKVDDTGDPLRQKKAP